MTRVSERQRYDQVQRRVEQAKDRNARQLDRISTQKDILNLSDDPIGAKQAIRFRDKIDDVKQYQKNIDYSKGLLERSEAALGGISDSLIRCKELAVAMANDTYDGASRDATSREVREVLEDIVSLGNSTFNGRYVFGGFRSRTPPVSIEGDYLGDDGALFLQIGQGTFRQVNLQARNLFDPTEEEKQKGHFNMINTVELLYDGLRANDKNSIQKAITELDFQLEKSTSYQATIGGIWKSLQDTDQRLQNEEVQTAAALSKAEDADVYDASSEFRRTEVVLQGTLMSATKLLQPSLLNFLQ